MSEKGRDRGERASTQDPASTMHMFNLILVQARRHERAGGRGEERREEEEERGPQKEDRKRKREGRDRDRFSVLRRRCLCIVSCC